MSPGRSASLGKSVMRTSRSKAAQWPFGLPTLTARASRGCITAARRHIGMGIRRRTHCERPRAAGQAREQVFWALELDRWATDRVRLVPTACAAGQCRRMGWLVYELCSARTKHGTAVAGADRWLPTSPGSGPEMSAPTCGVTRTAYSSSRSRPAAVAHTVWEFDVRTSTTRQLSDPAAMPSKVANNDWAVSPDGRQSPCGEPGPQHSGCSLCPVTRPVPIWDPSDPSYLARRHR